MKSGNAKLRMFVGLGALVLGLTTGVASAADELGTAFTYQGVLTDSGASVESADVRFTLWDSDGVQIPGLESESLDVPIANGVFTATVDFGQNIFDGLDRYLEIAVRVPAGEGSYVALNPRQAITATPYALQTRGITVAEDGKVGVGTTTPNSAFEAVGTVRASRGSDPDQYIQISSSSGSGHWLTGRSRESNKKVLNITNTHDESGSPAGESYIRFRVGPASTPIEALTIKEDGRIGVGSSSPSGSNRLSLRGWNNGNEVSNWIQLRDYAGNDAWHLNDLNGGLNFVESSVADYRLFLKEGGNVGIGTGDPQARLHVEGVGRFDNDLYVTSGGNREVLIENNAIRMYDSAGRRVFNMYSNANGGGSEAFWANGEGDNTIEIDPDEGDSGVIRLSNASGEATIVLDSEVSGRGRITVDELEITGGSDLSETFDVAVPQSLGIDNSVTVEAGMVVSIDSEVPGRLLVSTKAYDGTVAGVISGAGGVNPGMLMGQRGTIAEGQHPVALTGRVYVKATTANGTIRPGDLLTTSEVPGHAMKATDRDRAFGCVLGKAMTSLDDATGLVLVLVQPR
jgi:hypothetical protein